MNQNFYSQEEIDHILEGVKTQHRRDMLLHIDEILATLHTTNPAGMQWKSARGHTGISSLINPSAPSVKPWLPMNYSCHV